MGNVFQSNNNIIWKTSFTSFLQTMNNGSQNICKNRSGNWILNYLTLKSRTEKNVNTSFSKLSRSNELKVSDQLRLIVVHNKF